MNKARYIAICILVPAMCRVTALHAQTNVGDEDVDVVSSYNPILADAVKESFEPQLPQNNSTPEKLNYNIPVNFYQIPYQPILVKPIRLSDEKPEPLDKVFVKAGFGTQLTPLAEAYINSNRSKKYNYGLFGKYTSSNGSIENQNYSDLRLGGTAKFFFDDKYALPVNAFFSSDNLYYYGYNHDDTTFASHDIRQRFRNYGMDVGFHNIGDNPLDMDFGIKAGFTGISDINKYNEVNPFLNAFAEKELQNKSVAGASFSYEYYGFNGATSNYNYLTAFKPYYRMRTDQWSLKAGIETKVDKASTAYVLPDAVFSYNLIGDKLVFVAGWEDHLQKNNFENIVAENPFVSDTLLFVNTVIDELSAGIRGSTNGNFAFSVKGYKKNAKDLPFYINNVSDTSRFDIVYSDATMYGGNLELSYYNADHFRFTASVNAFNFSDIAKFDTAYHRPNVEWTFSGMYRFNKKLSMTADIFGIGKTWALLPVDRQEEIPGTADINISATYKYSKYFNIFLNLNNLASFKYERYYGYPSYGLQVLGGISFAF